MRRPGTSRLLAAVLAVPVAAVPASLPSSATAGTHHPGARPAAAVRDAGPGGGAHRAAGPGAPGAGDPYFPDAGNGGYDVLHYGLDLAYDTTTHRLSGSAVVTATATADLSRFDLDLRDALTVSSVTVDGRPAAVTRSGHQEVVVTPAAVARPRAGHPFVVAVRYAGVPESVTDPDGSGEGFVRTDDGAFVAGEPQGSPSWFPCSDHPSDKATATVSMTVPQGLVAVGNGTLLRQSTAHGRTTFVWNETRPMATYLTTITIGRFDVTRSVTRDGIPVYVAVDPREEQAAAPVLARLPEAVAFEESVFGGYPFETVGAIVDHAPSVGYALETQTRPLFDRAPDMATLVHELAHQWYGDTVTPRRWQDIWLNEGFATYAEWLWSEHSGGRTARALFDEGYATPASRTGFWNPPTGNPGGPENLFGTSVYERGALALGALRARVGDAAFFRILRDWVALHRYGTVTTAQFVALAERDSHRDLGHLFDVWLYRPGRPVSW